MRGDWKKRETIEPETDQPVEDRVIDIRSFKPKCIPQLMWRECTPRAFLSGHIKKVWEVDPLLCSNCGAETKRISFISEWAVIKKILVHLKPYSKLAKQRAPPAPSGDFSESVKYVSYDDGWSGYEEPAVDVKSL